MSEDRPAGTVTIPLSDWLDLRDARREAQSKTESLELCRFRLCRARIDLECAIREYDELLERTQQAERGP